ncbi:MAG: hypothetical protein IJZ96_01160 [Lachnospiraceae bacterium]|nr:hypothetical protein [Lachnospiraceae bacterium]
MLGKDDRWAKQFGDFAESLTMYVLGQLKNMSVALIDHVGADVIASNRSDNSVRYAISVKGRNIPKTESKSFNFSQGNIDKLTETANIFGMVPAVSFVFVDEMEGPKKIRIFVAELETLVKLCQDPEIGFLNFASDGLTFKYTESNQKHWLSRIKECNKISYFEMQFNILEDVDVFKN